MEGFLSVQRVVVVKDGRILARPADAGGPFPRIGDIDFLIPLEVSSLDDLVVVYSFAGEPPPDWRWMKPIEFQRAIDLEEAELVGQALLCA